jgi:hypothetical protein
VIDYLLEEHRVLKEQLESSGRRLRLTDDERRRLAAEGKPLGRRVLRSIAKTLKQHGIKPSPNRPKSWATFVRSQKLGQEHNIAVGRAENQD